MVGPAVAIVRAHEEEPRLAACKVLKRSHNQLARQMLQCIPAHTQTRNATSYEVNLKRRHLFGLLVLLESRDLCDNAPS
jgi:hypothetical protein